MSWKVFVSKNVGLFFQWNIAIAHCGNLAIFIPLWFYVKSIVTDYWMAKTPILTILAALSIETWESFWHFQEWNFKKSNFKAYKIVEIAFFTFGNQPDLISRRIRVAGKLLNFYIVKCLLLIFLTVTFNFSTLALY